MLSRLSFLVIAAFWVAMNALLWREEYGRRDTVESTVPAVMVWQKMLASPDSSSMVIQRDGLNIGFCRWATEIARTATTNATDEALPDDFVRQTAGYRIGLDGNVALAELTNHLRFDFSSTLGPRRVWRDFNLRFGFRHNICTLQSAAAEQSLRLKVSGGENDYERVFHFDELQNPQALLDEFDLPLPLTLLAGSYLPKPAASNAPPQLGLTWIAHEDWLMLGHTPTRIYRLQTRLLDRFDIIISVSRAGEILRAELPGGILLLNERLSGMETHD